jgi:hypothetical protein
MSTKIYNAYTYSGTLEELMEWLLEYRKLYERVAAKELYPLMQAEELLAERDPDRYKNISYRSLRGIGERELFKDLRNWMHTMEAIEAFIASGLNEPLNINASVVVYAFKGKTVVHFFGLDFGLRKYTKELQDFISNNKKFSDYSFWNNTDEPEGMTREEWEKRGEFYYDLTKEHSFHNSVGLVYELSNTESLIYICQAIADRAAKERKNEENIPVSS